MKRTSSIAFCILFLCSLLLLVNVGSTKAFEAGYSYGEYDCVTVPTMDGKWTTTTEWADAPTMVISPTAKFMGKIDIVTGVFQHNLVEIFNDNTNDAGDYWQICMDGAGNGGTAPDTNDWRIEIVGHTTLTVYQGNGAGWTQVATPGGIAWANSIDASPLSSTPHWILEFRLDKSAGPITNQPPHGLRVAVYDASNAAAGVQAWPPTPQDNPSRWGSISGYVGGAYPEGLTIGLMVLLSSVAMVVGIRYFRKKPKI